MFGGNKGGSTSLMVFCNCMCVNVIAKVNYMWNKDGEGGVMMHGCSLRC